MRFKVDKEMEGRVEKKKVRIDGKDEKEEKI